MIMAIMSHFIKVALSTCPIKIVFNSIQVMGNQLSYIKEDSYFFSRAVLLTQDEFDP